MRAAAVATAALALAAAAPGARAETLIASMSTSRVLISSNYTGSSVVAFGAIERDAQTIARPGGYDVVVTVRGPRQTLTVREKERLGPIWLNRSQQKFAEVPAFLGVLASRPIAEVTSEQLRRRLRVGLDAIIGAPDFAAERGSEAAFREALLRLRMRDGLYLESERGVTFLTPAIFRSAIPVPAIAPPGNYDVEIALFADSALLARTFTSFELVKIGFEQQVAELARERSAAYGAVTGLIALMFGWLASVVFRRD
jgi:uncharacterized protein (TIGR02186 family)